MLHKHAVVHTNGLASLEGVQPPQGLYGAVLSCGRSCSLGWNQSLSGTCQIDPDAVGTTCTFLEGL
jgi:hypothetical protein